MLQLSVVGPNKDEGNLCELGGKFARPSPTHGVNVVHSSLIVFGQLKCTLLWTSGKLGDFDGSVFETCTLETLANQVSYLRIVCILLTNHNKNDNSQSDRNETNKNPINQTLRFGQ